MAKQHSFRALILNAGGAFVEVPPGPAKALKKEKAAAAYFNSLSYTHKREYAGYIMEARREETRAKRIARTIEILKQGK